MDMKSMPVMFVGHGSPMHAYEDSIYSEGWTNISGTIAKPKAILVISAHWYTVGSHINNLAEPRQIYDMYGFPPELYEIIYHAPGSPALAERVKDLIEEHLPGNLVQIDNSWGIDHGSWTVLRRMYPQADIPVVQLSVDIDASAQKAYDIGQALKPLRKEGVLIIASGSIVHNLSQTSWDKTNGFPWAEDFDHYIRDAIIQHNIDKVIQYDTNVQSKKLASYAVPTTEHFLPLLYALGASDQYETVTVFNDACTLGSISMTSYLFHEY